MDIITKENLYIQYETRERVTILFKTEEGFRAGDFEPEKTKQKNN